MKKLTLAIALALSAAGNPVSADTRTNSVAVEYGDLNLNSAAGIATLDKRLARAIRQVCDPGWTRSVRAASETRLCIEAKTQEIAPLRAEAIAEARAADVRSDFAGKSL